MDTRASDMQTGAGAEEWLPYGTLALAGALGSLAACYGPIVAAAYFGIERFGLNPHLQAIIMSSLGLLAVVALARDRTRHGRLYPLTVAMAGVVVLVGTLYVSYDQRVEILAYVVLFVGTLLNWATIDALNDDLRHQSRRIAEFNRTLKGEVERQIGEIDRLNRLKGFLPPSIAEMVVAEGLGRLESHRQYIACLVCDIAA